MSKFKRHIILAVILILTFIFFPYISYSQDDLDDALDKLSEQINQNMVEQKKTKIAIIPFPNLNNEITKLGSYLAEELTTSLFMTGKFKVIERNLLKQVLDELKLSQSGVIGSDSAKELGKMTGVDAIVTGTLTNFRLYVAVNCRLIETETGEIFAAAKVKIKKDADVANLFGVTREDLEIKTKVKSKPLGKKIRVILDNASIKATRAIGGKTLIRVPMNTILGAEFKKGDWYKVTWKGVSGYIHAMNIDEVR